MFAVVAYRYMAVLNSPASKLNSFFDRGKVLFCGKGELVVRAGEDPEGVYRLTVGYIKVYSITHHGNENLHIIHRPGEFFPLERVFSASAQAVFYEAMMAVELRRVSRELFLQFTQTHPDVAMFLLAELANQSSLYAQRLDNLEHSHASERVAYRLIFLAERLGERQGGKIVITAPITHQIMASSLNLARETVSRELEKLEKSSLIKHQGHRLVILDLPGLRSVLGDLRDLSYLGLK